MISADEDAKATKEGAGFNGSNKKNNIATKWTGEQINKAQGVILEMVVWLRGKRVIGDVLISNGDNHGSEPR